MDLSRLELVYGNKAKTLADKRVAVFGAGGVGGYVIEALARCGVGAIDVFDNDSVSTSNINRQIIALADNVGEPKTDAAVKRILSINPDCKAEGHFMFYAPDTADVVELSRFDFVADAIDFIPGKVELAARCQEAGVPLVSSMGAGNKIHPELLELADIYSTSVCPLARAMRSRLRKRGVEKLTVVYSREEARRPGPSEDGKILPGSTAFVPSCAGLIMASYIVNTLLGEK